MSKKLTKREVLMSFDHQREIKKLHLGKHNLIDALGLSSYVNMSPISYTLLDFGKEQIIFVDEDFNNDESEVEEHIYYSEDGNKYKPITSLEDLIKENVRIVSKSCEVYINIDDRVFENHIEESTISIEERQNDADKNFGLLSPYNDELGFNNDENAKEFDYNTNELNEILDNMLKTIEKEQKDVSGLLNKAEFGYANNKGNTTKNKQTKQEEKTSYIETKYGYIVKEGIEKDTVLNHNKIIVIVTGYDENGNKKYSENSEVLSDSNIEDLENDLDKMNSLIKIANSLGMKDDEKYNDVPAYFTLDKVKYTNGEVIWTSKK